MGIKKYNLTILLIVLILVSILVPYYCLHQVTKSLKEINNDLKNIRESQIIESEALLNQGFPYKKVAKFQLTFYCSCPICVGHKKIIRTATGTKPKSNRTIAVDPKVIPLGSIVFIQGFGYFIAEDTGGAIKGNVIDVYVDNHQEALKLGRKTALVYVLK